MASDNKQSANEVANLTLQLGESSRDKWVARTGTVLGLIPFGSIVQHLITEIIPSQRLQRIERFLILLAERIDEDTVKRAATDPERLDTLEEGMHQATRSLSEERQRCIAELVARGLTSASAEAARARHFMRVLNQLDDSQIILLSSFLQKYQILSSQDAKEFYERHRDVLGPFSKEIGGDPQEHAKAANKDSMLAHLTAFGLLEPQYSLGGSGKSFRQQIHRYELTPQGREFLAFVGVVQ